MNDFTRGYMRGYKDAQKEALSTKCVAQPEQCTGCEGKPSSANNPCAVCGNSQPEQEPVGYFNANSDGKWEQSASNDGVPFYAALLSQPKEPAVAEQHKQSTTCGEPLEYWNAVEGWVKIDEVREHFDSVGCGTIYKTAGEGRVPLSLCKAQPAVSETHKQEPVAYLVTGPYEKMSFSDIGSANAYCRGLNKGFDTDAYLVSPLYTTPPQRKPLTDEQLIDLWPSLIMHQHTYAFARAIEAAHGIKE